MTCICFLRNCLALAPLCEIILYLAVKVYACAIIKKVICGDAVICGEANKFFSENVKVQAGQAI